MRAYNNDMTARKTRYDGTVYCKLSTKNVVRAIATSATMPSGTVTPCAASLIGSLASVPSPTLSLLWE